MRQPLAPQAEMDANRGGINTHIGINFMANICVESNRVSTCIRVRSLILSEKLETLRKVRELFLYPLRLLGGSPKLSKLSKLQRWLKLGDSRGLGSAHANYD